MWEEALRLAVQSGIFAVLFCSLLIYELRDSAKREAKYQKTIQSLADSLTAMKLVKSELADVYELLRAIDCEVREIRANERVETVG